jgi:hypothetical protein
MPSRNTTYRCEKSLERGAADAELGLKTILLPIVVVSGVSTLVCPNANRTKILSNETTILNIRLDMICPLDDKKCVFIVAHLLCSDNNKKSQSFWDWLNYLDKPTLTHIDRSHTKELYREYPHRKKNSSRNKVVAEEGGSTCSTCGRSVVKVQAERLCSGNSITVIAVIKSQSFVIYNRINGTFGYPVKTLTIFAIVPTYGFG